MTRQLAVNYGKEDIRANAIIVGFVFTGSPAMTAILEDPMRRAAFEKNIMVPRFGEPADIAAGVVYLASDESKYVTGTELTIDGGALCHQALPELDFVRPDDPRFASTLRATNWAILTLADPGMGMPSRTTKIAIADVDTVLVVLLMVKPDK